MQKQRHLKLNSGWK